MQTIGTRHTEVLIRFSELNLKTTIQSISRNTSSNFINKHWRFYEAYLNLLKVYKGHINIFYGQ